MKILLSTIFLFCLSVFIIVVTYNKRLDIFDVCSILIIGGIITYCLKDSK